MKKMKLSVICTEITDGSHNPPKGTAKSDFLMISSKNIYDDKITFEEPRYLTEEEFEKENRRTNIGLGDVLLTIVGTVGRAAVVDKNIGKITVQRSVAVLHPNKDICESRYLMYLLMAQKDYFGQEARGAAQKGIYLKQLAGTEVSVCKMSRQINIVRDLDKISALIRAGKEFVKKCGDLVKARFVEMFGDVILNSFGWKTGVISDYYQVKGGKRIPKGMGYSDEVTNHPYLRAADMKNETIIEKDIHYIDENVFQCIKKYTVKAGDVYITNVGVNLGMAGIIPNKFDGANLTENAVKLVPKTEKVMEGLFLAHYINSSGIQEYINERKMAVGVPKLAIFRIESIPIILPPKSLQNEFAIFVHQVDKLKLSVTVSLEKMETLRAALIQKYFK